MPSVFAEELCSLEHAIVGFYAVEGLTGKVVAEKNSQLSLMPSSCVKAITTGAALHLLGPDYRFETLLEYDGALNADHTLRGNLYIRGGGDPCLGSERIAGSLSWKKQIEAWADAIQKLGIRVIEGSVIGDATKWEKALAVPSWFWEDLGNYYGAGACGLSFHENSYSLVFKPGAKVGAAATLVRTDPPLSTLLFQNEVTTGAEGSGDRACIYGSEFSSLQFVRGTIPAGVSEFAIKGAIPDPARFCAELLSQELRKRGIEIRQQERSATGSRVAFHTTYSPTVAEIVHWTNRKSINLYAEHLVKKMGEVKYNEGSTAAGVKAITEFWKSQGVDLNGFFLADGSGLSRKNLVTPAQFVSILSKMKTSKHFSVFFESLPAEQPLIRAKSGSMTFAKGYVGYAGDVAFAVLVNQCADARKMNEKLAGFLAMLNQEAKSSKVCP